MMIYRGMDIGTAKPTKSDVSSFHYAGLDLADPDQSFSVHDYLQSVRGSGPWSIVTGGTGLYFRGLLKGLDGGGGEDRSMRREAESVLSVHGFEGLKEWCEERFPAIEASLPAGDRENPRRWIRAVERHLGPAPGIAPLLDPEACVIVGLGRDRMDLEERIRSRVGDMYRDGLIEEARQLRLRYSHLSETAGKAIGYAEAFDVLDGKIDARTAMERTVIRTRQYAKRQMTWFRNQLSVHWIMAGPGDSIEALSSNVMSVFCEQQ